MPVTVAAWGFDPFFLYGPEGLPPGWSTDTDPPGIRDSSGPPHDLTNMLTSVTLNDVDQNGQFGAGEGDQAVIDGETYTIVSIYDTDRIVVDGVEYNVVTIYMTGPTQLAITLPFANGQVSPAFPGMLDRAVADQNAPQTVIAVNDVICFVKGTMIVIVSGPRAVESLVAGDLVMTRENGPQPLRWLGHARVSPAALAAAPRLRPIRIRAGALGAGKPESDLLVSPQHRILVNSRIAARMFGSAEVLVAAKQLLGLDGIEVAQDLASADYYHLLFDNHEVVFANGAEAESLFTGPEALKTLSPEALAEIMTLFPELAQPDHVATPSFPVASGRAARKLADRHQRNGRALV